MKEDDLDLGERDDEEVPDFPRDERIIHTQGYDLSISTLKEQWDDNTLILPEFQREYVWDNAKASRLIESLLLSLPIPPLFFSETVDAKYEIVDGHQRVYSIVRYLDNQFALSGLRIQSEFKGSRFFKLPEREQRYLKTRMMRAIIIGAGSHPTMKFEVFERLNTGGLALNAQEIRHALYGGALNDLLRELEAYEGFRKVLDIARPRKRMVDRELILRFFGLRDRLEQYRTPLLRFLNDYMRDNRDPSADWLDSHRSSFKSTIDTIHSVLGPSAFRVIDIEGQPVERAINRAVFDAEMVSFSFADSGVIQRHSHEIKQNIAALFHDAGFQDTIRRSTGDRVRLMTRIGKVIGILERVGVAVDSDLLKNIQFPE
jgi:hypothetical protein